MPLITGTTAESSASNAAAQAIGMATRDTARTPSRLMTRKVRMIPTASGVTGMNGRYHWCSAVAERIAVKPQVGTQPHQ